MNDLAQQFGIAGVAAGVLGAIMIGIGAVPSSLRFADVKATAKQNQDVINEIKTDQAVMKTDIKYIKESVTLQAETLKELLAETKKRRR